jgi:alpha-1,2-glucosyltransferase
VLAALLVALAGLPAWYGVLRWARPTLMGDEYHHAPAIQQLVHGDWTLANRLPMFPTYHWLVSWPARVLGADLLTLRALNVAVAVAAVLLFHAAAQAHHADYGPHDLLRFAWNPLLLPFWVLVYTDLAALAAILLALNFHLRRRPALAAVGLSLAFLIRQSNVVWTALFLALEATRDWDALPGSGVAARLLRRSTLRRVWPYLLVLVASVVVIAVRGPLRSEVDENALRPNIAQFYGLALTAALLWAPVWLPQATRWLRGRFTAALLRPRTCAALIAALGLLAVAFRNPHPWNQDPNYVRNWPLLAMANAPWTRPLFAACIVAAVVTLARHTAGSPARRVLGLIWAATAVFVLPHYLVDPRYYVVTIVLVDFYTPHTETTARRLTTWYLLLTLLMAAFITLQPRTLCGIW